MLLDVDLRNAYSPAPLALRLQLSCSAPRFDHLVTPLASADLPLGQDHPARKRFAPAMRARVACRQTMGLGGRMIRTVQEFFCAHGRCREVQLADGPHYPVLLSIEQMPAGLRIKYRGHRDDLLALGCVSRDSLASARHGRDEDACGGALLHVENKAAPGRRRMIELSYFAHTRLFAARLPGVHAYCPDWLQALTARPKLRLVVDNTRPQSAQSPAQRRQMRGAL